MALTTLHLTRLFPGKTPLECCHWRNVSMNALLISTFVWNMLTLSIPKIAVLSGFKKSTMVNLNFMSPLTYFPCGVVCIFLWSVRLLLQYHWHPQLCVMIMLYVIIRMFNDQLTVPRSLHPPLFLYHVKPIAPLVPFTSNPCPLLYAPYPLLLSPLQRMRPPFPLI